MTSGWVAKVTLDLAKMHGLATDRAEDGLRSALGEYETILKGDVLNRQGTGRVYGKHQASAPGQPPAPDLGNLKANTNADPNIARDGDDLVGRVVANAAYASALHNGTERIAARPFMDVPAKDNGQQLQAAFVRGAKQ